MWLNPDPTPEVNRQRFMLSERDYEEGISVILPTCREERDLRSTLSSLLSQSLSKDLFEVIVIYSGPSSAHAISKKIRSEWIDQGANIVQLLCVDSGASRARNLGIRAAKRRFLTFLDDDDKMEPFYLERLLSRSRDDCVTVTGIRDYIPHASSSPEKSPLQQKLEYFRGRILPLREVPWVLGFNACKSFPTKLVPPEGFNQDLKSGEDVVFFAQFLKEAELRANFIDDYSGARYCRTLTPNSISRNPSSFDFSITQRLDCIKSLSSTAIPQKNQGAIQQLIRSQAGFIERFSNSNSELHADIIEAIISAAIPNFPWDIVKSIDCHLLMFCYCFPPFADSAANVAAKYLLSRRTIADVVCNDMSSVRKIDHDFWDACKPFIHNQAILETPTSFSNWEAISAYAEEAVAWAEHQSSRYREIYSRAMWVGSLVAGALYKLSHPEVKWVAEFSDPLSVGVDGKKREGGLTNNRTFRILTGFLKSAGINPRKNWTLFQLVEAVTYSLADEIRFTNENQRKFMTTALPEEIQTKLRAKSTVKAHENPETSLYYVSNTDFRLPENTVNIGYFGRFYKNRSISSILEPLQIVNREGINITLNVFAPDSLSLASEFRTEAANNMLRFYEPLPYLDFLSILTRMDCLLVNDTKSDSSFEVNPFLPSKYSDYKGSGTPIWGIVEEDSPLSAMPLDFKSVLGDQRGIEKSLRQIGNLIRVSHNEKRTR